MSDPGNLGAPPSKKTTPPQAYKLQQQPPPPTQSQATTASLQQPAGAARVAPTMVTISQPPPQQPQVGPAPQKQQPLTQHKILSSIQAQQIRFQQTPAVVVTQSQYQAMLGQQQLQKQQQMQQQQPQQSPQQILAQPSPPPPQQQQPQQVTFAVPGLPPSAASSIAASKISAIMHDEHQVPDQSRMLEDIKEESDVIMQTIKTESTPTADTKPTIIVQQLVATADNRSVVGRLSYHDDILYLLESGNVTIGRNSSTSTVNFHVGRSSFISRKHFQVLHDQNNQEFYVVVVSKNGIFVDESFNKRNTVPERLPALCSFRFPSTDIRIEFESFLGQPEKRFLVPCGGNAGIQALRAEHQALMASTNNGPGGGNAAGFAQLKIKIPKIEKKSPQLSPTGTLSAANSCPTSPRQSYREFQSYSNASGQGTSTSASGSNFSNNGYAPDPLAPPPTGLLSAPPPPGNANEFEKPLYSYAQLIVQSISASPEKQLTLSGIYSFITKNYPYYRKEANKGWQNSIRHNLSLNRYFLKVERSQDEPGKGSFWRIDPNSETKLIDQSYRKRRQRGSQCFRTPYGLPRSAPASPSHMENSRESSPLHDIVLQSAPGSPDRFQQPQQVNPQQQQHVAIQHHQQPQQQTSQHHHQAHPSNNGGGGAPPSGSGSSQMWPE